MGTYILRRLLLMIPTLIGITALVFFIVWVSPGGIGASLKVQGGAMQSQNSVALQQAYLEDRYGLDDPFVVQYFRWLSHISPIKFGSRDLINPSGEVIRAPKPVKSPPVWRWFADALPPVPATDSKEFGELEAAARVEAFKAAERRYSSARSDYIAASTNLKSALGAFAKATNIPGGVDRKGEGVAKVLEREQPDRTSPAWLPLKAQADATFTAYAAAQAARARLAAAFESGPYPKDGFPVVPGLVSIAKPDLGVAYSRGRPVLELISRALPVTLLLNLIAFPIIYLIAIPGGMLAAVRRGTLVDTGLSVVFIALWSVPAVLAGVISIGFLASKDYLGLFPVSGLHANNADAMRFLPRATAEGWTGGYLLDLLWHIALPVMCLVYGGFAILSKQTRAAMLDNFNADYVRTAKAKGVAYRDIVLRHVLRNSLLPIITMFVTIFPAMLAGSVVIEKIFTVPGMGTLILQAIDLRDRELILANTLMVAAINLIALLLADILYAFADPRVSYN